MRTFWITFAISSVFLIVDTIEICLGTADNWDNFFTLVYGVIWTYSLVRLWRGK